MSQEPPKIIVDDDWKREAQLEKERLAKQEAERAKAPDPADEEPTGPIGFDDVLKMLASQALVYMGAFPDPQTGRAVVAPDYAKVYIDMLGVIEDKTKGNLTPEEEQNLKSALYELRLQYVELSKAVAKAIEEGRISPTGATPGVRASGGMQPPLR